MHGLPGRDSGTSRLKLAPKPLLHHVQQLPTRGLGLGHLGDGGSRATCGGREAIQSDVYLTVWGGRAKNINGRGYLEEECLHLGAALSCNHVGADNQGSTPQ